MKENLTFYRIPIQQLAPNQNVIYLYSKDNYQGPAGEIAAEDIKILMMDEYKELTQLPTATIDCFITEKEKGKNFGLFAYIPHILSLGKVRVDDVEIITWNQMIK